MRKSSICLTVSVHYCSQKFYTKNFDIHDNNKLSTKSCAVVNKINCRLLFLGLWTFNLSSCPTYFPFSYFLFFIIFYKFHVISFNVDTQKKGDKKKWKEIKLKLHDDNNGQFHSFSFSQSENIMEVVCSRAKVSFSFLKMYHFFIYVMESDINFEFFAPFLGIFLSSLKVCTLVIGEILNE